ncbi:conserved hypothetical protein [Culex quinquefasciatus]|uniref:Uncharacterized protein n=1 Tax=Culex quinquefasciatus TaxID=7176 RepID=B0X5T5_CULQU|nr:conserved hypothetical protein [Culex quinquefasciatus]|eukprot:XP_001865007.1 conserved hypothetical protein [Culex quinquefasciatus]
MDTSVDESFEAIDLEDITFKRNNVRRSDVGTKESSEELQATDETASFLTGDRKQRGYNYPPPEKLFNPELKPAKFVTLNDQPKETSPRTPKKLDSDISRKSESRNAIPSNALPFVTRTTTPVPVRQYTLKATTVSTGRGSTTHETSTLNQKFEQKPFLDHGLKQKTSVSSTPSSMNFNVYTTARKPITKSKDKPYYTPTIPTITNKALAEQTTSATSAVPSSDAAEHAMEMMKTLQNLDFPEPVQDFRTGIEVPPSSGPNVLHSLALYFANDSGNTSTTAETPTQMRTEEFAPRNYHHSVSSSLLSRRTIDKYIQLFGGQTARPNVESFEYESRINDESGNDLEGQYSRHPLFGEFESIQVRELAQVFTHALSAYLQDPDSFRRILSEIRPKAPTKIIISNHLDNRLTRDDDITVEEASYLAARLQGPQYPGNVMMENKEVLEYSDVTLPSTVKRETTAVGLEVTTEMPKNKSLIKETPASKYITNNLEKSAAAYRERQKQNSRTSVDFKNELAHEVNEELGTLKPPLFRTGLNIENFEEKSESNNFVRHNTPIYATRPAELTTTSTEATPTVYFELLPPKNELSDLANTDFLHDHDDLLEEDEQLQRAQSQSLVASQNQGYVNFKKSLMSKSKISETNKESSDVNNKHQSNKKGYYITKQTPLENNVATEASSSKTTISYTVFLDPLTINDGLMNSDEVKATTISNAKKYLPRNETKATNSYIKPTTPSEHDPNTTTVKSIRSRTGKSRTVTQSNNDEYSEKEVLDTMQMKANKIFGKLNDEEADHLMHVMKTADTNKSVRRLILLLIQTCDDNYYKTAEESRKLLLNALINIDSKEDDSSEVRIVSSKFRNTDVGKSITTFSTPIVTYSNKPFERLTGVTAGLELESRGVLETTTTGYEDTNSTIMDLSIETYTKFNELRSNSGETETTTLAFSEQPELFTTTDTPTTTIEHETTTIAPTPTEMPSTTPVQPDERDLQALKVSTSSRIPKQLGSAFNYVAESSIKKSNRHSDTRALELLRMAKIPSGGDFSLVEKHCFKKNT